MTDTPTSPGVRSAPDKPPPAYRDCIPATAKSDNASAKPELRLDALVSDKQWGANWVAGGIVQRLAEYASALLNLPIRPTKLEDESLAPHRNRT